MVAGLVRDRREPPRPRVHDGRQPDQRHRQRRQGGAQQLVGALEVLRRSGPRDGAGRIERFQVRQRGGGHRVTSHREGRRPAAPHHFVGGQQRVSYLFVIPLVPFVTEVSPVPVDEVHTLVITAAGGMNLPRLREI